MKVIRMTDEQRNELKCALLEFVERAAQKGATAAEVEALPAVASILLDWF